MVRRVVGVVRDGDRRMLGRAAGTAGCSPCVEVGSKWPRRSWMSPAWSPRIAIQVAAVPRRSWYRMLMRCAVRVEIGARVQPASRRSSRRQLASSLGCGWRAMTIPLPFGLLVQRLEQRHDVRLEPHERLGFGTCTNTRSTERSVERACSGTTTSTVMNLPRRRRAYCTPSTNHIRRTARLFSTDSSKHLSVHTSSVGKLTATRWQRR